MRITKVSEQDLPKNNEEAKEVSRLFSSLESTSLVKTAAKKDSLNVYIDPNLAAKFDINLHLVDSSKSDDLDEDGIMSEFASSEGSRIVSAEKQNPDFLEKTITFASKRLNEPNYLCSVVFQNPEDVFAVSVYLTETYLGRYAFKSNYYFRKTSKKSALRCFKRAVDIVSDLKKDFIEKALNQNEIPYFMKRSLQGEVGEIEPKSNKIATYLDPKNVQQSTTIGSENIITIPKRTLGDDLVN